MVVALGRCATYFLALAPAMGFVGPATAATGVMYLQLTMLVNSIATQLFPVLEAGLGFFRPYVLACFVAACACCCRERRGSGDDASKDEGVTVAGAAEAASGDKSTRQGIIGGGGGGGGGRMGRQWSYLGAPIGSPLPTGKGANERGRAMSLDDNLADDEAEDEGLNGKNEEETNANEARDSSTWISRSVSAVKTTAKRTRRSVLSSDKAPKRDAIL